MLLTPIVAGAALVLLTAGPAFAAPGDTSTTFSITGGGLAISVPGPVSLGALAPRAMDTCNGFTGWAWCPRRHQPTTSNGPQSDAVAGRPTPFSARNGPPDRGNGD
jgi:hypothetical protein